MPMQPMFLHPALDLPLVRLSALLERATPDAARLLEGVALVAQVRIRRDTELRYALTQLETPPFVGPARSFYALSEHITQRDLLIALLAFPNDEYREMLFAGAPPNPDGYQELLLRAQVHYANALESKARDDFPMSDAFQRTLDLPWSASHALDWISGHDEPLTVDSLICALEPRAWITLAEFVPDYLEGLVTAEEAAAWLVRPYQERLLPRFGSMYVDVHGKLDILHNALLDSPITWIVGAEGSGRYALASAWITRMMYRRAHEGPLRGLRLGVAWHGLGSGPEDDAFGPAHGIGMEAGVHVLVCPDDGSRRGPATTRIGGATLTGGSGALEKLTPNDLRAILQATKMRPDAARMLIISTADERAVVCNAVPEMATVPVIEVSPPGEKDQLLLWLSKLPAVRLPGGALPHVSTMVAGFAAATEAERQERSVEVIERALLRGRVSMGDWAERIGDALVRIRRGRSLRPLDVKAVERFLGSEERLHALAALAPRWDVLT